MKKTIKKRGCTRNRKHPGKQTMCTTPYKDQCSIIHTKILKALDEKCTKTGTGLIKFPEARFVMSHYIRVSKAEMYYFFQELERLGLIDVIPYKGIVIKKEGTNKKIVNKCYKCFDNIRTKVVLWQCFGKYRGWKKCAKCDSLRQCKTASEE